jgi:hypothetical protein
MRTRTNPRARGLAPAPRRRRFVRERERAAADLLDMRAFSGARMEVEPRGHRAGFDGTEGPELAILWDEEVLVAARVGRTLVVRRGAEQALHTLLREAAAERSLMFELMPERRLWRVVGA